jgi:hypothetical protein
MIDFARGHRGVKRVLGELVAGDQDTLIEEKARAKCTRRSNRAGWDRRRPRLLTEIR